MKNLNEHEDKLDQYLLNRLSTAQKAAFEAELQDDVALQQALEDRRDIFKGIEAYRQQEVKAELQAIHRQMSQPAPRIRPNRRVLLAMAAAFVALVLSLAWLWNSTATPPANQLADDYFVPYQMKIGQRGEGLNAQKAEILKTYSEENYQFALDKIKAALTTDPNNSIWLLGAGNCLLKLDRPSEAIAFFDRIIDNREPFYQQQAIWYKGLAFLMQDDKAQAITQLQRLASDPRADHHEEAVALLGLLK